jgi:hypothetical protein
VKWRVTTAATLLLTMVAACSGNATGPNPTSSSGTPAPSHDVASVSPAAVCEEETTGCAGALSPGEHRSMNFDHPFAFTVGEGWTNGRDIYRAYTLSSAQAPNAEFIIWSHAAPAAQTPDCGPVRRPGFGTSVQEWLRSLTTDDRLDVTTRETFSLGSHAATRVEVKPKATFAAICPFSTGPFAVLVTDTENPPTRHHGGDGLMSMTFVDFGDDAIVIWNDGGDGTTEHMLELSLPVIKSIRFAS